MIKEIKFADHDEWLAIRHKYVGGSEAAAAIGISPFKSRYTLWAEKTDRVPAFEGNLTTEVGAYLEEFVADMFTRETGKKVRRKNATLVNDLYPWACANVDRMVVGEDAFLEIKTTTSSLIMRQLRGEDFPDAYYAQCVHYMAVTGAKKAYLAVLISCREFKVYTLERDEAEISALMEAERDFWECVEHDTAPAVDGSDSTTDTLTRLYPHGDGEATDLMPIEAQIQRYLELKEMLKDIDRQASEMANIVRDFMGDKTRGFSQAGFKVMYGEQNRTTFDKKRLAAEHPEICIGDYESTSTSRVLKISKKGD